MPSGVSPAFGVIESPVGSPTISVGPKDDWKWSEGRPPSHGSPLLPVSYIPWHKLKWPGSNIIPPKLSYQGFIPVAAPIPGIENLVNLNKTYTLNIVNNNPTFISDHHIISLRKLIEQLYSPKISAHIHLGVEGEIFVKPLYSIVHGAFVAADYYEYWPSIISPTNPETPYVFSVGGFVDNSNGHRHYWNAGASGYNTWRCRLHFEHGGAIPGEPKIANVGNYEILKIEYQYKLTKFFRKVFSQDGDLIWTGDYNAFTRKVHLELYDSFAGEWLLGYCDHVGDYFTNPDNTIPYDDGTGNPGRQPASEVIPGVGVVRKNVVLTACKIPERESAINPWFGQDDGNTHDVISPYVIQYDHIYMLQHSINRFCQQSVYASTMGQSVNVSGPLQYLAEEETSAWAEGEYFELTVRSLDEELPPPNGVTYAPGSRFVLSLIGTRVVPTFRVTYRDGNGNIRIKLITETELYGSNIPYFNSGSQPPPTQ